MDVENRHIKEEAGSEHRVVTGGVGEVCIGEADVREAAPGEHEPAEDARSPHHERAPRMVYSLNMNVCRLCLSEGHGHLQPVFYAQDSPDEILQQKILELTTVEITYANDFPTGVCIECLAKLDEFSLFRRQCVDNNEILKLKYYELKAEVEAEDYPCPDKLDQSADDERALHLSKVKEEGKEFIELGGAVPQHNGGVLVADDVMDGTDGQVPFVGEAAGNEIVIGDGQHNAEYGEQQPSEQPIAGTKIQYVSEDGTMTEYITAGAIVRREAHPDELDEPDGDGGAGHEIYYTVGTDTYAIPATGEDDGAGAVNYVVPPGYADQTEIECTTIEDHLPEEYVEEGPAALAMAPGGVVVTGGGGGPHMALVAATRGRHDRPFVCKHCKTSFKYEHNYDRHMKNHAKVLFRCGKCSKTFVKLRKCQQHFLKAHSSQRYECDICYRTYSLPTRLENHVIEMHSVNGVYRCDRCQGELFSSYLDFKAHRLRYHPRTNDATRVGGGGGGAGGATAVTELTPAIIKQTQFGDVVHMENVPPTFGTELSSPGSPTPSSDSDEQQPTVAAREQTGRTKRQYSAAAAKARARTNGHSNIRAGKGPKPLTISPSSSQQPPGEVILIDDDAEQLHQQQQQQQRHQQLDASLTNGTGTPTVHRELLQQIEESEASSSGPKVYNCESCRKTFVHLNNLKAHIYAEHDNDKPFKCKLCPISFKTKEILVMHMLLHTQNTSAT